MSDVDITDADGKWRITRGYIENRKTGEMRSVTGIPYSALACMPYREFMRRVAAAFSNGSW